MPITNVFRVAMSAMLLTFCLAAGVAAQVVQVNGKVTLKQADGTEAPVQGALVTIHRTDIRGKYEVKTDKGGRYVYAGIPLIGTYTIIVSAPNARPTFLTDVRLSQTPENNFTLDPGDGTVLTLEQVRAAGAGAPRAAAGGGGGGGAESAASKKAREEAAKKQAELDAENKKITETNAKLQDVMKLGNEAFNAKKYDEAISLYDQGIQADPEQAVFYRNKSLALRSRGVDKFNAAVKAKDNAAKDAARADFKASTEAAEKGLTLYREVITKRSAGAQQQGAAAGGGATAPAAGGAGKDELLYLESRSENYRIALQTSTPVVAEEAAKAIQEYVDKEVDPVKKGKAQASLGEALFQSGKIDESIAAYQQILSTSPDNLDAMYGLGLAMAADPNATPAKMGEARDMLKKFIAKAPDTHPKKPEATEAVAALDEAIKQATSKPDPDAAKRPARRKS